MSMGAPRGRGITYDTGFINLGVSTREPFEPDVVRREMRLIRDDLHCGAVRLTGGDVDRLELAATHAAEAGLEVWPWEPKAAFAVLADRYRASLVPARPDRRPSNDEDSPDRPDRRVGGRSRAAAGEGEGADPRP